MKQKATVVKNNGKLMARVVRPEACEACRACQYGQKAEVFVPLYGGDYHEGDVVELELHDSVLPKASILAYGLPLAFFFVGLWLGTLLSPILGIAQDIAQAVFALVAAAIGVFTIRFMEPRLRRSGLFAPVARRCDGDSGQ